MDDRFCVTSCEHCGQRIEFPADGVGMQVACPGCERDVILSESIATPSANPEEITAGELQSMLAGAVLRSGISIFYQAGLLLVALFMVLLPVVYLAFALCAGYGVYWYAVHATVLFTEFGGGFHVIIIKLIIYIGPILGGGIAVFFMFKPLLARQPKRADPIELNPAQHPRLYQFIAHLSDLLRVSMPKRIYLDCDLNASAGLRGWLSFFSNDLLLTIGLPLVAGLNTRQFAAVVAHELGHCTQWFALRLGYIIRRVNGWFYRVIYQRDTWDQALDDWSSSVEDWRMSLVVMCVHLAVWISRKVLMLLMLAGHAVSCFLSRQMEYHADSCAMAIAGSEGLESLLLRLREQAILEQMGYDGLRQIWQKQHQLPDSVPDFLEELEKRLPEKFREEARATLLNETAGLFATHPTAAQRIKKARQCAMPGIFDMTKPARALFKNFVATAKAVTARHYRQNIGLAVTDQMLKPVAQFFQPPATIAEAPQAPAVENSASVGPKLRLRRADAVTQSDK